jgi:hypothetical protein
MLSREVRGAAEVARQALMWSPVQRTLRRALINGAARIVTVRDGRPLAVGAITVRRGRIVEMNLLADPDRLARLDLRILEV